MRVARRPKASVWIVTGLLWLAYVVRVVWLTRQSLWRDEVDALRFATAPWPELVRTFNQPGWNGPLYFAFLRGWIGLAGQSEFALRYFSLLFGVIAVALAYVLARRLAGRTAAWLTPLFFALSPYLIWYSQEAKMYTLILALATLSIYALRRALDPVESRRHIAWWVVAVVATTIAMYCHILAALLIPLEMVLAVVWGVGLRRATWWVEAAVALAFFTLPYLPLVRWQLPFALTPAQTGYAYYPLAAILQIMLYAFTAGAGTLSFWNRFGAAVLWPSALITAAGVFLGSTQWRNRLALLVWLFLPPAAIWIVSLNRPLFVDRYLIWIGPAFYVLLALGIEAMGRVARPLAAAVTLVVLGLAVWGIAVQVSTPLKADFRGAARFLDDHYRPGDLIVFQIPYVRYNLDYYFHRPYEWADGPFTNDGMSEAELDLQMSNLVGQHKTVWLVASEMEMWDNRFLVLNWLETHGRRTLDVELALVWVFEYDMGR